MKSRNNRLFWTALGMKLLGESPDYSVSDLPSEMHQALEALLGVPEGSYALRGTDLEGKKRRHVYMHTWKILRNMGFSRPFRREVFSGVELLIPFVKGGIAVVPQGFQNRIPLTLRAYALVGKSAVLRAAGIHLVVTAAVYDEQAWGILSRGNCSVCTPDELKHLITTLDLQL